MIDPTYRDEAAADAMNRAATHAELVARTEAAEQRAARTFHENLKQSNRIAELEIENARLREAAKPLVWSKEPPNRVGLWQFRHRESGKVYTAVVTELRHSVHGWWVYWNGDGCDRAVMAHDYDWCPIPEPQEPQE